MNAAEVERARMQAQAALDRAQRSSPGLPDGTWEVSRHGNPGEYEDLAIGQVWARKLIEYEVFGIKIEEDDQVVHLVPVVGSSGTRRRTSETGLRKNWRLLRQTADGPPVLGHPFRIGPFEVELHETELVPCDKTAAPLEVDVEFLRQARLDVLTMSRLVLALLEEKIPGGQQS